MTRGKARTKKSRRTRNLSESAVIILTEDIICQIKKPGRFSNCYTGPGRVFVVLGAFLTAAVTEEMRVAVRQST